MKLKRQSSGLGFLMLLLTGCHGNVYVLQLPTTPLSGIASPAFLAAPPAAPSKDTITGPLP